MKKVTLLALVLVLCLSGVGVGYAMWSDTLYIDGTVNTGSVDVDIQCVTCSDSEIEGKNVSGVTCSSDGTTLTVIVENAYPCITYTVEFLVTNTGTIPVHFTGWAVDTGTTTLPLGAYAITDLSPVQLHEGLTAPGTLTIHLENDMAIEQGGSYALKLSIVYHQYNEALA